MSIQNQESLDPTAADTMAATVRTPRLTGMTAFVIIWIGQIVSLLGTRMTTFAVGIWAWQLTGQAQALALVTFSSFATLVLASPIAGALVDRSNRKLVMMLSDMGGALATISIIILYFTNSLEIWHLYVINAFLGVFQAFQGPAYASATVAMLSKEQYTRVSGMMSLAQSVSGVFAPIFAGVLIGSVGVSGIFLIDIATFSVALVTLLIVHVAQPASTEPSEKGWRSLLRQSGDGFRYIRARPSLLAFHLVLCATSFLTGIGWIVLTPMILARTGNDQIILASVLSAGAVGGIIGGMLVSTLRAPKQKIHGVLLGLIGFSLLGRVVLGLGQSVLVWTIGWFCAWLIIPFLNSYSQAIWLSKIPRNIQGRVSGARQLSMEAAFACALLSAGWLADKVFEPAMMPNAALSGMFGWLVGTGPGAGMSLMFILSGIIGIVVGLIGYAYQRIRNLEAIVPDHEEPRAETQAA